MTRPKTILHLIETVGIGGAERVLVDLVRKLDRQRWRCAVVVPCDGWLRHRLLEEGIETVILEESGSFDVGFLSRVASLVRKLGVDIIHSHLFGSTVRAGLVARVCGIPAIGTIHGQVDFHEREKYRALKLGIIRGGVRRLVFVSDPLRRASMKSMWFRQDLTSVIANGVDSTAFAPAKDPALRSEFGASADDFVVGCVGRLHPVKGGEIFLEAAAILRATEPGYRFVIVGDGDEGYTRSLMDLRDRLGLADDVTFVGFRSDVHRAMSTFDAYALTSHSEGFSLSTIEAMASGVPVVATRCGGPEAIIENGRTGLLVDNRSPSSVASAIAQLRHNPKERRSMADNARGIVLERYTVDAQVQAYARVYEDLLPRIKTTAAPPHASYAP